MLSGGTNYYPFNPGNDSIEALDRLLAPFDEGEPSYQVNLRLMKEIFSHITSDEDVTILFLINCSIDVTVHYVYILANLEKRQTH